MDEKSSKLKDVYLVSEDGVVMGINEHYRKAREWLKKMPTWSERISFVLRDHPCNQKWKKITEDELKKVRAIKDGKLTFPEKKCDIYINESSSSYVMPNGTEDINYDCQIIYLYDVHAVYYYYQYYIMKSIHLKQPEIYEDAGMLKDEKVLHEIGWHYEESDQ